MREPELSPLKVLIVEDSNDDAVLLLRELKRAGFDSTYRIVDTANDMLAALDAESWELILSDYSMPQFDGLRALQIAQESGKDVPFIIVSGTIGEDIAVRAMKAGAHDYLIKGKLARLGEAIRREMEAAQSRAKMEKAEHRVVERQSVIQIILDGMPFPIMLLNKDRSVIEANIVAKEMGVEVGGYCWKGFREVEFVREAGQDILHDGGGKPPVGTRCRFCRADQSLHDQEYQNDPAVSARGNIYDTYWIPIDDETYLHFALDVTDRKQLQEQLNQSQKMESVGRLAGGIAHDFNNLLTVILGSCFFMTEQVPREDPMRDDLDQIRSAGNTAVGLTRQLLAFSRRQAMQPKVLNLNHVVREQHRMLSRIIGEDVELVTLPGKGLWPVEVDPGQIEQVVMNLAINSRDAMPDGGKLTLETSNVELDEEFAANHVSVVPGPYVMLAISDNGCGMDSATRDQVFEPFFTTKEKGKGTGLGMSMVYGVVKQSGGSIWVYSEPGEGTSVKIYLPRVEGRARPRTGPMVEEPMQGSETLLVVEDEQAVRSLVVRMLRKQGYSILEAANGEEAERIASGFEGNIDLLLTDVVMPGRSGRKTAEALVAKVPGLKVVYMSGYTDNAIVHHGVLEKGTAFLEKPFSPFALARKIRTVLDGTDS